VLGKDAVLLVLVVEHRDLALVEALEDRVGDVALSPGEGEREVVPAVELDGEESDILRERPSWLLSWNRADPAPGASSS